MNHPGHATFHMIEQMTVKKPISEFVGFEFDYGGGHGGNIDSVFEWSEVALFVDNSEEVAVKVHRVVHHGSVDHYKSCHFTFPDSDRVAF